MAYAAAGLVLVAALLGVGEAQSTDATCRASFDWMTNSRGQSPCLVAAYVQGACTADGEWTVQAIPNSTVTYSGPTTDQATMCTCSSVAFALCSACAYCQGDALPYWTDWVADCPSNDVSNGQFPVQVPGGTDIPAWAYQQIDMKFNVSVAQSVAATAAPALTSSPTQTSSLPSTPTSTTSSTPAPSTTIPVTPPPSATAAHSNTVGPIVGGAVGGGIGALLALVIVLYCVRRGQFDPFSTIERPEKMGRSDVTLDDGAAPAPAGEAGSMSAVAAPPVSPGRPMKLYDPEDPSTYPTADLPTLAPYQPVERPTSGGYVDINPHYPIPASHGVVPQV